jgi:hypothetical protein
MNLVNVSFDFEFGHCNGAMNVDIYQGNNTLLSLHNVLETHRTEHILVNWPSTIIIRLSGKNMEHDTIVDNDNNIVADKHVKLLGLTVNGFKLIPQALYSVCGEVYWGHPGERTMEFTESNPMRWNLALNNVLYFREV